MNVQRPLAAGALALMLAGSAGGLVHGLSVGHETLLSLREHHQPAFEQAARGDMIAARAELQHAIGKNFRYVRVIDAHTHIIKLASLALLLSFLLPLLPLADAMRRVAGWGFLSGAILFPGSVLLQVWWPGLLFQSVAAVGAVLIIVAMGLTVYGLYRLEPRQ